MLEPHPLNTGFTWADTHPPYAILTEPQARHYDQHGYVLIKGAFTPAEIAEVIDAIAPYEQALEQQIRDEHGGTAGIARAGAITFTAHMVKTSPVLRAFSRHPVFQRLARDILGEGARLYWDQAVYKKPGNAQRFPWHQDNGYTYVEPQQYLTCWTALTDATEANGCPQLAPGVHKQGTLRHQPTPLGWECMETPERRVVVEAAAGDIVVFSSLTPHLTGPNLTDTVRKSYILQYAPAGARVLREAGDAGVPQDDPERQYVLAD